MAKRTEVLFLDDTDGVTAADKTVAFALEGQGYEIDLSAANADELYRDFAKWAQHARKVKGTKRGRKPRTSPVTPAPAPAPNSDLALTKELRADIRRWAAEAGVQVGNRGRIPDGVVASWRAAVGV